MKSHIKVILLTIILQVTFGLNLINITLASEPGKAEKLIKVSTGLAPFKTFIEKIGKTRVSVATLLPPGSSAHSYTPSPRRLAEIARTDVYFSSGMFFESRLTAKLKSTDSGPVFVDLSKNVKLLEGSNCPCSVHLDSSNTIKITKTKVTSIKRTTGKNSTGGKDTLKDPHTWMDPSKVITMLIQIKEHLALIDKDGKSFYSRNCIDYINQINATDKQLITMLKPFKNEHFYVYHPSLGYFAKRYNIKQIPIETGGKEPSGRQLATLIRDVKKSGVQAIIVQKDFPKHAAKRLSETINKDVKIIDPLSPDYCNNLLTIGKILTESLSKR